MNLRLSTQYIVLYPQNGDRIVAIDSVASLHLMYSQAGVLFPFPLGIPFLYGHLYSTLPAHGK